MPSSKPSKNDQIDTKLLPDAKIGAVPRGTQFSQIPMLQIALIGKVASHIGQANNYIFSIFNAKEKCNS